jgi:hypothetical protein
MDAQRTLACLAVAAATLAAGAPARAQAPAGTGPASVALGDAGWPSRGYLGLNLERSHNAFSCSMPGLACEPRLGTYLYGGYKFGKHTGVEVGVRNQGRMERSATGVAEGVDLSLVGQRQLVGTLSLYGRVGATYGRNDTAVMGAAGDNAAGVAFGAGLRWMFAPQASATLGFDTHRLLMDGGTRDGVRAARIGVQWQY